MCRFEDKNGVVRTKLNLNSVYRLGDIKKLAFKLWVNDMNSKTALTTNSSEKVKFDRLTDMLNGCDLHSVLKEIFPDLGTNNNLLNDILNQLNIESLDLESLTTWPIS